MADSWKDRERVKEEEYFQQQNKQALLKLKGGAAKPRLSPITGEPMDQVNVAGVIIDHCRKSGYVGLDSGDLKKILKEARTHDEGWFTEFFETLRQIGKK
jgi:hypothetical protein